VFAGLFAYRDKKLSVSLCVFVHNRLKEDDYKIRMINYTKCNLYIKYLVISQTKT
jgi:hypothetical protein